VTLPGRGRHSHLQIRSLRKKNLQIVIEWNSIYAYDGETSRKRRTAAERSSHGTHRVEDIDERSPCCVVHDKLLPADGLVRSRSLSSAAGALVNTYTYDSFGQVTGIYRFACKSVPVYARDFDIETNLQYSRGALLRSERRALLERRPEGFAVDFNFLSLRRQQSASFH